MKLVLDCRWPMAEDLPLDIAKILVVIKIKRVRNQLFQLDESKCDGNCYFYTYHFRAMPMMIAAVDSWPRIMPEAVLVERVIHRCGDGELSELAKWGFEFTASNELTLQIL